MELLALMKEHGKSWALYVFSSANAIRKYTMEELVELGVSWVWMGLESPQSSYSKLNGTEHARPGTRTARSTASSCWDPASSGWNTTRRKTSQAKIEYAIEHDTDFHQFMLYTPVPGTPLYKEMSDGG